MPVLKFQKLPENIYIVSAVVSGHIQCFPYVSIKSAQKRAVAVKKWSACTDVCIYTYRRT